MCQKQGSPQQRVAASATRLTRTTGSQGPGGLVLVWGFDANSPWLWPVEHFRDPECVMLHVTPQWETHLSMYSLRSSISRLCRLGLKSDSALPCAPWSSAVLRASSIWGVSTSPAAQAAPSSPSHQPVTPTRHTGIAQVGIWVIPLYSQGVNQHSAGAMGVASPG